MIFGKFFKAKWQHKDASVRVLAINEDLSPNDGEQFSILETLVSSDESDLVRRAALIRLNQFASFLQAQKSNSSNKIKEFANKTITNALTGKGSLVLSDADKAQLIDELDKSQLEVWLATESDEQRVVSLYGKINKPHLLTTVVFAKQTLGLQQFVIDKIDDVAPLEKLAKKTKLAEIKLAIEEKVAQILHKQELPEKISKAAQLVLSKLLALKDVSDYQQVIEKQPMLLAEWQSLVAQFSVLSAAEANEFTAKFDKISEQVTRALAPKAEQYQQQQILAELAEAKKQTHQHLEQSTNVIREQLANAIFQNETVDEQQIIAKIEQLTSELTASALTEKEQKAWHTNFQQLQSKLNQLPKIAESVAQGTQLISKMSQVAVPESVDDLVEKHDQYKAWQKQWRQVVSDSAGYLPASIIDAHSEIAKQWQTALSPLLGEQKRQYAQVQKKTTDLKRLIATGKYNAAFGVYKRVQQLYNLLSDEQKGRLSRDYDFVSEKMAELADWEHYIATPKKKALLAEINAICETPLDNPQQQADKVKAFRKQWNSLGHADDEIDRDLNKAFNQACETAFAPCRAFYAGQDKLRAQHKADKQALIEKVNALSATELADGKTLESQVNQFIQQWKLTGEVDRNEYKTLQQAFNLAIKPLRDAVTKFQQGNTDAKKALIAQANEALTAEDVFVAVNQVKDLQNQWKTIGYSGAKEENKLWRQFRKINDEIFAKRNETKSENNKAQQALETKFSEQLTTLEQQIAQLKQQQASIAEHNAVHVSIDGFIEEVYQHKPVLKKVIHKAEQLKKQVAELITAQKQQAEKSKWLQLFSVLEQIALGSVDNLDELPAFTELSNTWQKRLQQANQVQRSAVRENKTLELEILAGIDSPKEYAEQRMQVQVGLMQQQMSSGGEVNVNEHLNDWILAGQFNEQDANLIARIKPIFC